MKVVVVQSLSLVQLFATPWTSARLASLSIAISPSLVKLMSIKLVMSSNYLIICLPLLHNFSGSFPKGGQSMGALASESMFPMNVHNTINYRTRQIGYYLRGISSEIRTFLFVLRWDILDYICYGFSYHTDITVPVLGENRKVFMFMIFFFCGTKECSWSWKAAQLRKLFFITLSEGPFELIRYFSFIFFPSLSLFHNFFISLKTGQKVAIAKRNPKSILLLEAYKLEFLGFPHSLGES